MSALSVSRILIAIDFSENARYAFTAGLEIAAKYGAEAFVLHVSEPIRAFDFGKQKYIDTKEGIERVEEGVNRRINELWEAGGLEAVDRRKVHLIVRGGKADQEIVETANVKNIDLIVMGASGAGSTVLGSTSERVLRSAPCSVLCVRHDPNEEA